MDNPSLLGALDFTHEADPAEAGMSAAGVQQVLQVLEDYFEPGGRSGAQLVLARDGRVVLDRAVGTAHRHPWPLPDQPIRPDTPFLVFSTTKPFTAMCIHKLAEEGQVDLEAPVSRYWPAFGWRGKEAATVRQVLAHQAGIPRRGLIRQWALWPSWRLVTRSIARLPAETPPGSQTAYHTVNGGFVLGEIVRQVSGIPIQEYLERHFFKTLGMHDTALGLPPRLRGRAAGLSAAHFTQVPAALAFGFPPIRQSAVPAASLHSSARDLAVFFQMLVNGGIYNGQRWLQEESIRNATALQYDGIDRTTKRPMRWALGFHLGGRPSLRPKFHFFGEKSSERTFGHAGQGTCIAWGDFDYGLVLAFTCNQMLSPLEAGRRWQALADAVWAAVVED